MGFLKSLRKSIRRRNATLKSDAQKGGAVQVAGAAVVLGGKHRRTGRRRNRADTRRKR
jgi:hypothetical protein